jgi:hypothetical protein
MDNDDQLLYPRLIFREEFDKRTASEVAAKG